MLNPKSSVTVSLTLKRKQCGMLTPLYDDNVGAEKEMKQTAKEQCQGQDAEEMGGALRF